jgi:hypothetical protein
MGINLKMFEPLLWRKLPRRVIEGAIRPATLRVRSGKVAANSGG